MVTVGLISSPVQVAQLVYYLFLEMGKRWSNPKIEFYLKGEHPTFYFIFRESLLRQFKNQVKNRQSLTK